MATLYSGFAPRRSAYGVRFWGRRPEWPAAVNRIFLDVLGHFWTATVAKRRQSLGLAAVVAAALLGGCATGLGPTGLAPDAPAEVKRDAVAARAKARWEALIKADLDGAYAFLSPASRATMPLDLYKAKHRVGMYRAVDIDAVSCQGDACTVNLRVTYDHKRLKGTKVPLVEKWVITEGQAWFVDRS